MESTEEEVKVKRKRSALYTIGKVFLWIIASVLFLIMLVLILIQTSFVQNFARKKVVGYLQGKLHTEVKIGKLDVDFPTTLSLQNVFIADQSKDTLLYGKELAVNMDMVKLISSKIDIKKIALNGVVAKVKRLPPDSVFNFQFIVDAFNTPSSKSTSTDTSATQMNIDEVLVNKTRIIYKDLFTGNDMDLTFGHLDTKISTFDPTHLLFNIPSFTIDGLKGYFYQLEPLKKPVKVAVSEKAAQPDNYLQLINDQFKLSNIDVAYKSEPSHINTSFVIGNAVFHPKTIDLKNSVLTLKDASMDNSTVVVETASQIPDKRPPDSVTAAPPTPPMKIFANDISINKVNVKYDDSSMPKAPYGMDYSHLGITDLSLKASHVEYSLDTMKASIQSGSMKEKSGFVLDNLTTDFSMNPTGVALENLSLKTPGSDVQRRAIISYPSLTELKKDPGTLGLNLDLRNSKISMKDLWTFVPQLKDQTSSLSPNAELFVDAIITGKVNNMNLQHVVLKGLSTTDINVDGVLSGLPNANAIYADLNIHKFQTAKRDIIAFIPPNTLPSNISLPTALSANGKIKGGIKDLYTNLSIQSSSGNAAIDGTLQDISDKNKATYDVVLHTEKLQLGSIMQNPQLGSLTADFKVKGQGYDPQTANATFNSVVSNLTYNNYNYHNIQAHGNIAAKKYKINATVYDPNLTASVDANGIFSGKYPTLDLNAKIDSIKTKPLNLSAQKNIYHGDIAASFSNINPDSLNGHLLVTHSILVNDSNRVTIDSILLNASNSGANENIVLRSDVVNASINGKYKLTQLGDVFYQSISPYYSLGAKDTVKVAPYDFTVKSAVIDNPAIHAFIPAIDELRTINMQGNFSSDSGWAMYMKSPHLVYAGYRLDSLQLNTATRNNALAFNTKFQRLKSGSSIDMYATSLSGTMQNNKLNYTLDIKDQQGKDKYRLTGNLDQPSSNKYVVSISPDSLLLNYEQWNVNQGNQLVIAGSDISAHNFVLSKGSQQLSVNSEGNAANAPLAVKFSNFKLLTLSGFIQNDSLMVNGLLNGNALIKNLQSQPLFTSDLSVENLSVYGDTLGTLTAKVNNNVANQYAADVRLEGRGNDVKVTGNYNVKPSNSTYDFVLDITKFQMKSLEGLTGGAIKDARGNLYGKVAMNGSLNNPNIDGKIQFNNTSLNVATLNNVFKVDKESIAIVNNKGIILNSFTIRDTSNNPIVIDGALNSTNFIDYTFNLKIRANNFQAINSTNKDNQLFYGKMVFSTRLTVKGSPSHPIVDGNLVINNKTDFTVVLPQNTPGIVKRKGIVRFVDRSASAEDSLFMAPYDSLNKAPFQGYDVSININVDKDAVFNMIVDAGNGDFLRLKGAGQMTAGIDASGKITLVGSYVIDQGTYNLTYNFLKRKFNIQKGSKIVWTGEPTTGQLDVTAIYVANAAPIDLVQGQIESTNSTIYKQRLPFQVTLTLKGELLQPQIGFDVVLPQDQSYTVASTVTSTVRTKLAQIRQEPNEMNKQVFSLLLLNRFMGENPFASSGGSMNAGFVAMQSASRLLSEQLNQLTNNLIPGVDVNADLSTTQDYTTGTEQNRTDLNVGLTKRLLNDRLTVTVGNDFQLQGPSQTNQNQNSLAGNVSINYKLTKDGRYEIRVYRKNDYTGELEGYVIESGIGFIVSVDYNKFKQIFKSKQQRKQKRQIKKQNREIKKEETQQQIKDKSITPPSKA
ncbi:MAG: translocation/assembly module TamB domain-containing protein [Ginsengibacter sp.]